MEAKLYGQNKGGMSINGIIKDYYAYARENISAGDLVEYINGVAGSVDYGTSVNTQLTDGAYATGDYDHAISAIALDNKRIFISYPKTNSYYWYGMVVTLEGATINLGTEVQLNSATSLIGANTSMVMMPDGNIFVAHIYPSYAYLYATVLSISDNNEISVGTVTQLSTKKGSGTFISTVLLPDGKVFVAHSYGSSSNYHLYCTVCTVSGKTITPSSNKALVTTSYAGHMLSTKLLPNGNVFIAHGYSNPTYVYGMICTVSGTTVTAGTDTKIGTEKAEQGISSEYLPNGKIVVAHSNYMNICTISGTTISSGADIQVLSGGVGGKINTKLLTDNTILFLHGTTSSYYLQAVLCTVADTSISFGTAVTLCPNAKYSGYVKPTVIQINSMLFIAHCSNNSTIYNVHAQMFDVINGVPTDHVIGVSYEKQVRKVTIGQFDGVAKTSGIGGDSTGHNSLIRIWTLE